MCLEVKTTRAIMEVAEAANQAYVDGVMEYLGNKQFKIPLDEIAKKLKNGEKVTDEEIEAVSKKEGWESSSVALSWMLILGGFLENP